MDDPAGGGHSVGCHIDNAKAERKRTMLFLACSSPNVRFVDTSIGATREPHSPSIEYVPQSSPVPKSSTSFTGR